MGITLGQLSHFSYYISKKNNGTNESESRIVTLLNDKGSVQCNHTIRSAIASLYYSRSFIYFFSSKGGVKKEELFDSKKPTYFDSEKKVLPIEIPSSMLTILLQIMVSYSRFFDGSVSEYLNFYSFQKQYLQSSRGKHELYYIDQKDYLKEWILIDSIIELLNDIQLKLIYENGKKVTTDEVMSLIFSEIQRINSVFMEIDPAVKPLQETKNEKNTRPSIVTAYEQELRSLTAKDFEKMKKIIIQWWFPLPTKAVAKAVSKDFHLNISDDPDQIEHVLQKLMTRFAREESLYGIERTDPKGFAEECSKTIDAIHTLGIHFNPEIPDKIGIELLNLGEIIFLLKTHYSKFYKQ